MGRGYGGYARLVNEDAEYALYEYGAFNWNIASAYNDKNENDGCLFLAKSLLVEPEIRMKRRKKPTGGHHVFEKKIIVEVHDVIINGIQSGEISIEKSKYEWKFLDIEGTQVGLIAERLLSNIFEEYQIAGEMPVSTSLVC